MTPIATLETTQLRVPQWSLPDRLRKARDEAGLGQVELGERIGASQASIVHWEAGRRVPRAIYLREWARCCRVPLEWLETGMAPAENDGSQVVRPKGFEPLTF